MRTTLLLFISAISTFCGNAQCLAPFRDIRNEVYVCDNGMFNQVERFPVKSLQVSRSGIMAYIDTNEDLKVYYHGEIWAVGDTLLSAGKLLVSGPPRYTVTDNFMVCNVNRMLGVLYDGRFIALDTFYRYEGLPRVSDSLVVWQDGYNTTTYAFYNGGTQVLDLNAMRSSKNGSNIFAWVDASGRFKIFYHGKTEVLEDYEPQSYLVGRDIVLYSDQYGRIKYYQDGGLHETDIAMPAKCWVGDGFATYATPVNEMFVIYNGEVNPLTSGRPTGLKTKGNMMIYADEGNNFFCWYKGESYRLESYVPQHYLVNRDILVYQDETGRLKAFYHGEQIQVSDEIVKSYELFNETITYHAEINRVKVWCNKEVFVYGIE